MKRIRVASLQYFIRPVATFDQFRDQVESLVETAADHSCHLMVFPEYFTAQLLTLGDVKRPIEEQIRDLAMQEPRFIEVMTGLSKKHGLYIVGGTIPYLDPDSERIYNHSYLFSPSGDHGVQGKMHMTRWEVAEWRISARNKLRVFETDLGRIAIAICYDVEFPEIARAAARLDAHILAVPSCTEDRLGFLRVRYCAHARAIENHMYVIHSGTVGSLPMVPAVHLNWGQAGILTPSDYPFARDGILAEGLPNQESMIIGDLDMDAIRESRTFGAVLPLEDSKRTGEVVAQPEVVSL